MVKIDVGWVNLKLIIVTFILLGSGLSLVSDVPVGETAYQKWWISLSALSFGIIVFLIVLFKSLKKEVVLLNFNHIVTFSIIFLAGLEAISGLRQLYGFTTSNHSLYALTGSFYNPGPYSGYLAMVFPLALYEWLKLRKETKRNWMQQVEYYLSLGVLSLILCVLPAGMSRSAWLAATISGIWVYGMHHAWGEACRKAWRLHRKKFISLMGIGACCLLVLGISLFHLKRDSANGRLFMWKISCRAIAERPLTGYGTGHFAEAYGKAQEIYFEQGAFSPQEELVAGSPEYAFNEYLQVAVEWGVLALVIVLGVIGFCFWRGVKLKRLGICGAILSLMVFAFSSYPMQIPAFVVSLAFLLAAAVITRMRGLLIFALLMGLWGGYLWHTNKYRECEEWSRVRMLYNCGAYRAASEGYAKLYPALSDRGAFLFEYGHTLHKLKEYEASNEILKEATIRSCDPMIQNIIGKNYQGMGMYDDAETWLIRSTHLLPGRIYPYYLLAKLYAEPAFDHPEKMKEAARVVLTKEPKVQSTAVREMRAEIQVLLGGF